MKCLILCMCCNNQYYIQQWQDIKNTWAKDILDKKYPNIDIYMYTSSGTDEYNCDFDIHELYVPCNDSLSGTFEKTVKAIQSLNMFNIEYDCILRTNCSTIINVKLLDAFLQSNLYDPNKIYTSELFLCDYKAAPFDDSFMYRGNFMLFSKKYASLINFTSLEMTKQVNNYNRVISKDMFKYDDITINAIFNTYILSQQLNLCDIYQRVPIQYFKEIYEQGNDVNLNGLAFFTKDLDDYTDISKRYPKSVTLLNSFYYKYYDTLTDNLEELNNEFNQLKYVEQHVIVNNKPERHIIPFDKLIKGEQN